MATAYDAVTARLLDGIADVLLVGDSLGNVCLGFDNTLPVTMAMMSHHLEAVMRTKPRALVVADMPYLSFHLSIKDTLRNAGAFMRAGAGAVKLEGGAKRLPAIRALIDCEIPVMGHLGLTPQSVNAFGGFKVQGRVLEDALSVLDDAQQLQEVGCFAIVLEGVPSELAARATESLDIPTIGIGGGPHCSGQVLVFHDILGLTEGPKPKFVRTYLNGAGLIRDALGNWAADVRAGSFPSPTESYTLPRDIAADVAAWRPEQARASHT
jgi:3-methyl-2-oxobutanoate hydroxymethyltransferase